MEFNKIIRMEVRREGERDFGCGGEWVVGGERELRRLEARHTAHFLGTGAERLQCRPGGSSVEDLHRSTPGLSTLATPPST